MIALPSFLQEARWSTTGGIPRGQGRLQHTEWRAAVRIRARLPLDTKHLLPLSTTRSRLRNPLVAMVVVRAPSKLRVGISIASQRWRVVVISKSRRCINELFLLAVMSITPPKPPTAMLEDG